MTKIKTNFMDIQIKDQSFAKLIKFDKDQDKFDGYTNKRLILVGQSRNNGSGAQPTVSSYGGVD